MYGDGSHAPDSCWSPSSAVSRRLQNSCDVHASRSAERSTICSNLSEEDSKRYVGIEGATTSLAKLALARSMCPLPPLSDGIYGGGSSVPCGLHLASDVCLESLERSAPHRIVVPQIEVNNGRQFSARGELDGNINTIKLGEEKAAIWNAVSALASLCDETQELDQTFQTKLLPAIVLFGADDASALPGRAEKKDLLNEEVQEKRESKLLARLGESMKVLQMAANATTRLKRLVKNMVVQLGAVQTPSVVQLYFDNKSNDDEDALEPHDALSSGEIKEDAVLPPVFGEGVPMFRLGKSIAVALRLLISVDKSVSENQNLNEAWGMYKDVVVEMSEQKRTTDGDIDDDFESFERMLVQLENTLLSSRSFLSAIEQNFDPSGRFKDTGFQLHEEVRIHLITLYGSYCEKINTPEETTERLDCIGVYAMYVLYRQLLPSNVVPDKSLHKSLWTVFPAMCPVMQLYGPLYFQPREFLMVYSPYKAVKGCFADSREIHAQSKAAIIKWDGSFDSRVARIRFEAVGWLAKADSELCGETLGSHSLEDEDELAETEDIALKVESATNVIFRGIKIAYSASILLRSQLSAHKALNLGVAKQHIPSINSLMEVLKSIEKMLRSRRRHSVSCIQRATLKMIAASILRRFESVREFVDGMSSSADLAGNPDLTRTIVRVGACLTALEGLLKGSSSFSPIRRHAIAFTIAACMDSTILEVFSTDDLLRVESSLKDLSQVASLEEIIKQACDCSFLCFHRDLALECLRHSFQANLKSPINHTQLVLSAFSDPERILARIKGGDASVDNYRMFLECLIKAEYIRPTCELIEDDLRRATSGSPGTKGVKGSLRRLLTSLYACQNEIPIKQEVEASLSQTYYGLVAADLSKYDACVEMRVIAHERYSLQLEDSNLPGCGAGIDFVEILEDLRGSFISRYKYSMIEEMFIERNGIGSKNLETINTDVVVVSIRQHGLGIVSMAVANCHKLLAETLLDTDSVKSLLSRELRWFINQEKGVIYSFDRASKFTQEFKQLRTGSGNALEDSRAMLSDMGSVISLLRLVRAATRKYLSDEMQFLSSNRNPVLRSKGEPAIKLMPRDLSVDSSASAGAFFCMIPALSLCHVEASLQGKDSMQKMSLSRDGYFADDGLSVGISFMLSTLNQFDHYKSLNWFRCVQAKFSSDEEELDAKRTTLRKKSDAKVAAAKKQSWFSNTGDNDFADEGCSEEMSVLEMIEKKLQANRREMAMLFFSMNGAQSLFL